jgi:hypothetical protein
MKYSSFISIIFFGVVIFTSMIFGGSIKSIILLSSLCVFFLISVKYLDIGAVIVAGFIPMNGIIRWSGFNDPITAGYTTGLYVLFFVSLFFYQTKNKPFAIKKYALLKFFTFMVFLCIIIMNILRDIYQTPIFFMHIREYIIPLIILFPFYFVLKLHPEKYVNIIIALFFCTLFVAIINLLNYSNVIHSIFEPFIVYPGSKMPAVRQIGPIVLPRLNPILGLAGQAGSVFYTIIFFVGEYLYSVKKKIIYNIGAIVILLTAFCTMSSSTILTFFLICLLIINARNRRYKMFSILFFVFFIFVIIFMPINMGTETNTIFMYGLNGFILPIYRTIKDYSMLQYLTGAGLPVMGGQDFIQSAGLAQTVKFDRYIFIIFLQLGIVGFFSMIVVWITAIPNYKKNNNISFFWVSLILLTGLFGFVHGAAPTQRLFSPLFALGMAFSANIKKQIRVL